MKGGAEYLGTISFSLKEKTTWADAGFEIAFNQFGLTGLSTESSSVKSKDKAQLEESPDSFVLSGT